MKMSIWDILSVLVLTSAAVVIVVVLLIFVNPNSSINPFQPPALPPTIMIPSPTATLVSLPPTWTPLPIISATPRPSSTPIPSATPFKLP